MGSFRFGQQAQRAPQKAPRLVRRRDRSVGGLLRLPPLDDPELVLEIAMGSSVLEDFERSLRHIPHLTAGYFVESQTGYSHSQSQLRVNLPSRV